MSNDPSDWSTRYASCVLDIIIRWLAGPNAHRASGPAAWAVYLRFICTQQIEMGDVGGAYHTIATLAALDHEARLAAMEARSPRTPSPAPEPAERKADRKVPATRRRTVH